MHWCCSQLLNFTLSAFSDIMFGLHTRVRTYMSANSQRELGEEHEDGDELPYSTFPPLLIFNFHLEWQTWAFTLHGLPPEVTENISDFVGRMTPETRLGETFAMVRPDGGWHVECTYPLHPDTYLPIKQIFVAKRLRFLGVLCWFYFLHGPRRSACL